jgi:hypothetical protein
VSHQKKIHNQTVVGMRQYCCISALQYLIMEGEQPAPDQFNHMDCHYESHLDDIGAPREIWMRPSKHHKKGSKWFGEQKMKAAREYRKDLVNKAAPHWYCGSGGNFHECFTNCTHALWGKTSNQNDASAKSKGQLERYNVNVVPVEFVATIMFSMLDPRLSKGVINNSRNRGPYAMGNDGDCTQTNVKNHESRATTKRKKEKTFCQEEREVRQENVDLKSRKADLLASKQNKKVKGEFEILDPIDAQMEATVQETHQNVIKNRWDIIAEDHKIFDMNMYVKRFVTKEFPYLLDNDNTNDTPFEVDGDDDGDETELKD